MGKGIYTYYKERLIEIGGKNKCLYLKGVVKKGAYDIGRLFEGRDDKIRELTDFLWSDDKNRSLSLISKSDKKEIAKSLSLPARTKNVPDTAGMNPDEAENAWNKYKKQLNEDAGHLIASEISKIKELAREVEEIEKETGKYELYIGYPFVFGSINQGITKTLVKAPLVLFPVKIDIGSDDTVELRMNNSESIQLNRALIFAYAQAKRIDLGELELEFESLSGFGGVKAIIDYLASARIKIDCSSSKQIYNYSKFKEPEANGELSVRYGALLARLALSNSIYNDYSVLEKKNLTNDAIVELLRNTGARSKGRLAFLERLKFKKPVRAKRTVRRNSYIVKMLDFSQSEVVKKVDEMGNMVIYGPPGTGKSQTIVNIITDAICKNKKVLVVSQKKAALDVVHSRLGTLGEKAIYVNDEGKERRAFYEACAQAHKRNESLGTVNIDALQTEYDELQKKIDEEEKKLEDIHSLLCDKRPFGLSLSEMYTSSYMFSKNSSDYDAYLELTEDKALLSINYKDLSNALFAVQADNLAETYYKFVVAKEKNPLIDCMLPDVDIPTLSEVKGHLELAQRSTRGFFNISKYPYTRQVLANYSRLGNDAGVRAVVNFEDKLDSGISPFGRGKRRAELTEKINETLLAITEYTQGYECLNRVMTRDGYISVIDNILRGNKGYVKLVHDALDNYIAYRDVSRFIGSLNKNMLTVLDFAYSASKNYQSYREIISKLMIYRIYHEISRYEDECKDELAKIVDFSNITSKIYKLKESQLSVAHRLCAGKSNSEYRALYESAENAKDYLYQISKEQKFWPIRKTMELYSDFVLKLFPCWLLSPENVSSLLPLKKNMFDIVIFDEASQVFIENTIPTIYRGKNIVVAGDAKQLRPSATFMKRYMGADPENQDDLSVQAALEVDSLLDLAVARYDSANLTYHYRSRHEELINFSNAAFYSSTLQIAPNTVQNADDPPIKRYKVDGKWVNRTNAAEAKKIVELLGEIFKTRQNNESIGIITFNSDQQTCIADAIDAAAKKDSEFRVAVTKERYRLDDGEDTSLFIKNLENVQGDERDIIIFSIGYAKNEQGKLYTNFGSLSADGGENRLNVAITRAKSKIIVVTSIEPEELKVEDSKNAGPRLLKEYLIYVRAVSSGDTVHAKAVLEGLDPHDAVAKPALVCEIPEVEEQIKERLEKLGYTVHLNIGGRNNKISLAIFDEETNRYLVGVELDKDAFESSACAMERDVYKPKFLEARGWTILRVWCRDWWLSPVRVIKSITTFAEKNRKELSK